MLTIDVAPSLNPNGSRASTTRGQVFDVSLGGRQSLAKARELVVARKAEWVVPQPEGV
jgi:hypothetical protein